MASRSKRPETGKHTVRWRDLRPGEDGRRAQHRRTCPDAATAARLQRDIDAAHALGREYVAPVDTAASIDQIIEAYLDDCERTLKPGTVRQKRNALDLFARWLRIETPRGLLHPDLLSGDRLARWHAWLLKDRDWRGKPVGPLAAGQYVKIVGVAWAWAYESERYGGEVPRPRKIRLVDAWPTLQAVAPTWAQMDQGPLQARGGVRAPWAQLRTRQVFIGECRLKGPLQAHSLQSTCEAQPRAVTYPGVGSVTAFRIEQAAEPLKNFVKNPPGGLSKSSIDNPGACCYSRGRRCG